MKKTYNALLALLFSVILISSSYGQAETPMGKCKGKYLGNVMDGTTNTGADYNYNTYWNQVTAENGCKWGSVEGSQGSYNFSQCDVSYNWAKNNNGFFKYHNLAWGSQTPGYISTASTATITAAVENYIAAVAAHYGSNTIDLIDVFNEPVHTALPGNYKAALTAGYQAANPGGTDQYGWIIWVFQLARKAFPNAKLLMNEYSIENDPTGALVTYAAMANSVLNAPNLTDGRKNLIDGLGLQCHAFSINASTGFTAAKFQSALDKLYSLTGLPMHITEMDLDADPTEATQSSQYQALFPVAWAHPHVAGMTLWGYVQGFTWRNGNGTAGPNGTDSGIMYASTYGANPGGQRPALTWIQTYMAGQPNVTGCPLPGTYGPGWATQACTTAMPTTTKNVSYCVGATAKPLTATAGTGGTLNWYLTPAGAEGGSPLTAAPTPSTAAAGTTYYYVSQTIGCESFRDTIIVTVNSAPCTTTTSPITVALTAPANNANLAAGSNITLTATASATSGTISQVAFYEGSTLIGTATSSPYTITWNSPAAGSYQLTAVATNSAAQTNTSTAIDITVVEPIYSTTTAPTIDGVADALWGNYPASSLNNVLVGTISSPAYLSANWKATWDATNLYVLVTVQDNVLVNTNQAQATIYNDDGIEIYIDMGNTKTTTYGANQFKYSFRWNDATVYELEHTATTGVKLGQTSQGLTAGCTSNCSAQGYTMEVSIPWTTLGVTSAPAIGNLEGFDVAVNDDDTGTRNAKISWNMTTDNDYQDPADFGTVIMEGSPCTPPTATISNGATASFCTGGSVVLNANTGTGLTYQWNNGGTAISGATSASYTATAAGTYTISVTNASKCSATSTATTVTVNAIPAAPTVSPVSYCQNTTATALTATATGTLNWYTVSTNGTGSATAPTPSTAATGTTSYYVSQTTNTCESPRAAIAVTVNAIPAAPTVSPVSYCQNATATALTATGTALKWYTVATAGTASSTAPTPATTATGTTSYYVSQTTNSCESPRAAIAVIINAIPTAPTVSPVSYCQNTTATALTATATGTLNWYTVATNGTASSTAPTPATTVTGTTSYYVSQITSGCESPRAAIAVTVNAIPTAPTVTSQVSYCQNATATALTATGTALKWYTVATNGTASSTAPTPSTAATGTTSYYVSQTTNTCESPRAAIAVTINAIPAAPTVTASVSYCQNATATALTATGTALKWYTVATNGTSSATAPTPSTTAAGTTSYYVSQTANACESPRASIAVTVSAAPTASNAGAAQYITNASTNLSANVPTTGAGTWSVLSGTANFANSTSATTSVSGLSAGANVLQWTIANGSCPSSSSTVTINVGTSPTTQTITGPTQVTTNATGVIYSVSDDNGSHYKWSLPTGVTIVANNTDSSQITVSFGSTGGTLSVTETNPYGNATSTLNVSVGNAPSSQTISGPAYVTPNETAVAYSVPDDNGSHYLWTLPTGATIASHNADSSQITVDYGTSGGTVSVTETNPYGTASSSLPVSVGNAPSTQTITGPATVTANETGVVYSIPDNNGSHYLWTLPTGATIASHNADSSQITVNYGTSGGTLSVTETNPYGNATSTLNVSVGNAPTTQTITGEIYVPINSTGVAYSIPDNNGSHYLWTLPTGATIASHNADSSQITVNYGTSGGTVTVTETNPYGSATSTVTVSVGATPTTQTITGPATVTANETGVVYSIPDNNGSTYHWTIPAGASISMASTDSSQITLSFGTTGGTVTVTETNPYGNATSTLPVSISSTTAVIAGSGGDSYEVKPNPFSDYTTIIVHHSTTEQITLSVINVQGISCFTSSQYYTNQEFTIGSELTTDGVYFVQLSYGAEVKVLKLVKVR